MSLLCPVCVVITRDNQRSCIYKAYSRDIEVIWMKVACEHQIKVKKSITYLFITSTNREMMVCWFSDDAEGFIR